MFGAQIGDIDVDTDLGDEGTKEQGFEFNESDWGRQLERLKVLRQEVPRLVWQSAGICREQKGLTTAIAQVEVWQQEFAALPLSQFLLNLPPAQSVNFALPDNDRQLRLWAETRNLLDVAYLILKSAVFRTESRGGHYRLDYPQPNPSWQVHTLVQKDEFWKSTKVG